MADNTNTLYQAGKKIRQARTAVVRKVEKQERVLDFVLSTENRDRYNTEVIGWNLKNFRANPQLQWAHSYAIPSIGNALRIGVDADKRLVTRGEFTPEDINPFGYGIYLQYAEGWMRTWSAGFVPAKVRYVPPTDEEVAAAQKKNEMARGYYQLLNNDLLEGSAVPIPGNAECLTLSALAERGIISRGFEPVFAPEFRADMTQDEYEAACEHFLSACRALTEFNGQKMDAAKRKVIEFFAKRGCEVVSGTWDYGDHACERCGAQDEESHAFDCKHARTVVGEEREAKAQKEEREKIARGAADNDEQDDKGGYVIEGRAAEAVKRMFDGQIRYMGRNFATGKEFYAINDDLDEQTRAEIEALAQETGAEVRVLSSSEARPEDCVRGALPFKKQKLAAHDTEWNAAREAAAASIDDLFEMSAFYSGEGEKKGDYKLLHHKQAGYETVLAGVKNAMAQLNGGRAGVNVPAGEKAKAFKHLALHYKEFDAPVPELKAWDAKGELRACTPEAFFEIIEKCEHVSRGNTSMHFASFDEGADTPSPRAAITYRAGELDVREPVDAFLAACRRWFEATPEDKRSALLVSINERGGIEGVLVARVGDEQSEPTFTKLLRESIRATSDVEFDQRLVGFAAELPLTASQVREVFCADVESLRDAKKASVLREHLDSCLSTVAAGKYLLDAKAVLAAFDADVASLRKDERQEKLSKAQRALMDAAALFAEATGDDAVLRKVTRTGTERSEDDDQGDDDEHRDLGDEIVEGYMGSGAVDASRRIREKAREQDDDDTGGGQHQSAQRSRLLEVAKLFEPEQ